MRRGTDRLNRALLSLIGILLAGLGTFGMLRGTGVIGGGTEPVIPAWLRSEAGEREALLLGLLAAAALLLIWLGLRWLFAQLPTDAPVGEITLDRTEHASRVKVSARAVAEAVAADVRRLEGVTDASARVVGDHPLTIQLDVSLEEGTDLTATTEAIARRPKRRLLEALELPDVDLRARLKLAQPAARRVA
jgi:hypothetical protein